MMKVAASFLTLLLVGCTLIIPWQGRSALREQEWHSYDGKTMPLQIWAVPAGVPARGVVIAVHGLSGAKSDFWLLGQELPPRGYAVYAYDVRGQGNDPMVSERGDIPGPKVWQHDLATFHALVERAHPTLPVFWYGESLGSLIALHAAAGAPGRRAQPDGVILASPVAGLRHAVSGVQRFLLEAAAKLSPRSRYSLGELAGVDEAQIQVTSETTHGSQMAATPHHVSAFTLRLLSAIGALLDRNAVVAHRLRMPVLFVASPNDVLSSPDQVQALFAHVHSHDKKLLWYARSHHLLLHDVQRDEVVADVLRWLDRRSAVHRSTEPPSR